MRRAVAGPDCMSPHDLPPRIICSDPLCTEWLERWSVDKSCDSEHAHVDHYWSTTWERGTYHCPGRQYCDPMFLEPL